MAQDVFKVTCINHPALWNVHNTRYIHVTGNSHSIYDSFSVYYGLEGYLHVFTRNCVQNILCPPLWRKPPFWLDAPTSTKLRTLLSFSCGRGTLCYLFINLTKKTHYKYLTSRHVEKKNVKRYVSLHFVLNQLLRFFLKDTQYTHIGKLLVFKCQTNLMSRSQTSLAWRHQLLVSVKLLSVTIFRYS